MNPQDPLAALHPLREPLPVGWWPPAPGWWLLAALVLVALLALAWFALRRYRANAYRRQALARLRELATGYQQQADPQRHLSPRPTPCSRALPWWPIPGGKWPPAAAPGGWNFSTAASGRRRQFPEGFVSGAYHQELPRYRHGPGTARRGELDQAPRGGAMIEWIWPWMLALAPLPWLVRRLLPPAKSQEPALRAPFFEEWQQLSSTGRPAAAAGGRRLPAAALWLIWLLLLLAAARPTWIGEAIELAQQRSRPDAGGRYLRFHAH